LIEETALLRYFHLVPAGILLILAPSAAWADDIGITDDTVRIGSIVPLSGPAAPLSIYVRQLVAYTKYLNAEGGVKFADGKTRKIEAIPIDSGGQPARALAAARELVEQDRVFLLASPHGTNENLAIADYLNAKKVPQAFVNSPATTWGADVAKHPWSISFPPVPGTQVSILVSYIKAVNPRAKIAILYANDLSGRDALAALKRNVANSDLTVAGAESYEFTDTTVDSQIAKLAASDADTFINYAIGRPALQALQKADEIGWKPLRLVETSTASSGAIKKLPAETLAGIVSAAYVKDPTSPEFQSDPAIKTYNGAMAEYFGPGFDPSAQPLGAAEAETLAEAFRATKAPTREAFLDAARKLDGVSNPYLLPGVTINLASSNGFTITQMQVIRFQNGNFVRIGDVVAGPPL
jgi:branched-chain amino acid transport system substrate-binding protein